MKKLTAVVVALALAPLGLAQDRIPPQEAEQIAQLLAENAAKVDKPQLKTDVDAGKPFGLRKGGHGAMVLPDKKLTADLLAKAGKEVTPLGQLWFRQISPLQDGKVVAADKLRIITVNANGEDHHLPLFFLGVRKKADEALELVVYAKDQEPLLVVPLTKSEGTQELPLELEAQKGEAEKTAVFTLKVLGKYQAKLSVGAQES